METFGRYQLLRRLAVGGMAEIFLARSASIDGFEKTLVIKRIRSDLSDDAQFSSMFIDEARLSIGFAHPNIVQVFDFGKADNCYYLAMEHVAGCDLGALLQVEGVRGVGLDHGLALLILEEACKGLDYAHNILGKDGQPLNIVHRDVSPANIMLSNHGAVKVADFGIAEATRDKSPDRGGCTRGACREYGRSLRRCARSAAGIPRVDKHMLAIISCAMSQVTIYLPEDVAVAARRKAKQKGCSLSAYLAEILARDTATEAWPESFVNLIKQGTADLIEPDDPPLEEVEPFE